MSDSASPAGLESAELPALSTICQSLALLAAEGASVGLAGWALRIGEPLEAYVVGNAIPAAMRRFVLLDMLLGALAGLLLAAGVLAVRRRAGVETVRRLAFRLLPLALSFFVPLLFDWKLWQGKALQFLVLAGLFGLSTERLVRVALVTPPVFESRREWPRLSRLRARLGRSEVLPFLVTVAAAAGYAAFFAFHTIRNHYRLGTASLDLGLETNLVWNALHGHFLFKASPLGGPTTTHAGYHQTYLAYLLGLPFWFSQKAETLLAIQAVFMGAAAIPLYFLAKRNLSPWIACLLAVLYVFYPPLHGANLYDFHYLPLGTFFLWTTLYLLLERRYWASVALVVLTLSVREDISALLAVVGGYLLLSGRRPVAGLVVSAVGAAYFVVVKLVIMPRFLGGADSFVHQYILLLPEGERGFSGILKTVIANLPFTLGTLLDREKLTYLLQIIVPLAFFPWRRPVGLLCSVPGFFFTLLATNYPPLIQTSFQYTAYWTTFLFLAVIDNLEYFTAREAAVPAEAAGFRATRRAWLVAMSASLLVTSYQFGALLQQHTVRGGFGQYRFDLTIADHERHARLYKLIAQVPPKAKIVSSECIVPQIASRPDSYTFRNGMYDAEYFIAWMPPRDDERGGIADSLKSGKFGVIDVQGEFILAKRGHETTRNAEVINRYHL